MRRGRRPCRDHDRPTTDRPPTNHAGVTVLRDLLAEERAALAEERAKTERLIESATMWQVRALQAEDRLKQLTAGGDAPSEPQGALGRTESGQPVSDEGESWWRRVLGLTR